MLRLLCRWLLPVALAAPAGVWLAIWNHGGQPSGFSDPPAAPRAAPTRPTRERGASNLATAGRSTMPESRRATPPVQTPAQLERLARRLGEQVQSDVGGALATLLALDEGPRDYLAEGLLRQAAEHDHPLTLQWLGRNVADQALRERLLAAAYAGAAEHAPMFAINEAATLTDPEIRRLATQQVLEAWAGQDPVSAFEWVRSSTGAGSAELFVTVMYAYAQALPEQAGDLVATLPEGAPRDRLVEEYAVMLAERDAAMAAAWLSALPPDATTRSSLSQVFERWAEQDPWVALEEAVSAEGELAVELLGKVAAGMGAHRPQELAGSLEQVPEEYRAVAAYHLARVWTRSHARRARDWAEALPAGEVRDQALRGLAQRRRRG